MNKSTDIIGVVFGAKDNKLTIRIRGIGPTYDKTWKMLDSMPHHMFEDSWDNFPWSGFSTRYEIIPLEIGKIVGIENISEEYE